MKFLSTNSAAIIALATVVIAVFSVLMWWLSRRIHQASIQRDREMTDLYLNLVTAILASGRGIGEHELSAELFTQQKEELLKFFQKPKSK